jgi:hypothetical protein
LGSAVSVWLPSIGTTAPPIPARPKRAASRARVSIPNYIHPVSATPDLASHIPWSPIWPSSDAEKARSAPAPLLPGSMGLRFAAARDPGPATVPGDATSVVLTS